MTTRVTVEKEIRLDQFLKWAKVASTGGQSKFFILGGLVKVNGEVEIRRGRILRDHDLVQIKNDEYLVKTQLGDSST